MADEYKLIYESIDIDNIRKLFASKSGIPNIATDKKLIAVDDLVFEDKANNIKYSFIYVTTEQDDKNNTIYKVYGRTFTGNTKLIYSTAKTTEDESDSTTSVLGEAILGEMILGN
jgi:hypothetical protein